MPLTFNCPGCGKGYSVPEEFAGRATKCRACAAMLTIPFASEPPAAPIAAVPMAPFAIPAPAVAVAVPVGDSVAVPMAEPVAAPARLRGLPLKGIGLIAAITVAVVLLGYTSYALLTPTAGPASMKFMPDNCTMLMSARVADMMKSGAWADVKKEFPDLEKTMNDGLKDAPFGPADIDLALAGVGNISQQEFIFALEMNRALKEDEVRTKMKAHFTESTVGNYKVYEEGEYAWALPSSKMFLFGKTELLKNVLKRDKHPEIPATLQKALKETDLSQSMAVAMNVKGFFADPMLAGMARQSGQDPDSVEVAVMNMQVGKEIRIVSVSICKDVKAAEDNRKMAEGAIIMVKKFGGDQLPKELIDIFDGVKISQKDTRLTTEITINVGTVIKAVKKLMEMGGGQFGGQQFRQF